MSDHSMARRHYKAVHPQHLRSNRESRLGHRFARKDFLLYRSRRQHLRRKVQGNLVLRPDPCRLLNQTSNSIGGLERAMAMTKSPRPACQGPCQDQRSQRFVHSLLLLAFDNSLSSLLLQGNLWVKVSIISRNTAFERAPTSFRILLPFML